MKVLGIFLAYSPLMNMKREGLGRYLSAFIRSATTSHDLKVVIAVPSWSRTAIRELLAETGVPEERVEIIGPRSKPLTLRLYFVCLWVLSLLKRRKRSTQKRGRLRAAVASHLRGVLALFGRTRNPIVSVATLAYLAPVAIMAAVVAIPLGVMLLMRTIQRLLPVLTRRGKLAPTRRPIREKSHPQHIVVWKAIVGRVRTYRRELFHDMHRYEMDLIIDRANHLKNVDAWYLPTAFWATSNRLVRPSLVCVPDIVLMEFPASFAREGGNSTLETLSAIQQVLAQGQNFVTYSERTKWRVLVQKFMVRPDKIQVIPHAPMDLSRNIEVSGFKNNGAASRRFGRALLAGAVGKSVSPIAVGSTEFKYLFFATQFRPSKNIVSLLRAYRHLLRNRFIGHKLILTGDPNSSREVRDFIEQHNLGLDVLFLKNLTEAELAACYKLADLAVNPSLSEGGMPFTFTEALSVGTPVVMGDIEVTREILTDPVLAEATLFDPYDWQAIADKIEWALDNREALYQQQRAFYDTHLATRSWDDVVSEHIALLEQIAATPQTAA